MIGARIVIHAGVRPIVRAEVVDLLERLADSRDAWTTGLDAGKARPILELALSDAARPRPKAVKATAPTLFERMSEAMAEPIPSPLNLPLGAGLGTVRLGEPVDGWKAIEKMGAAVNDSDRNQHANFGWPMLDLDPWSEPIPCKGAQGFWDWPEGGDAGRFARTV